VGRGRHEPFCGASAFQPGLFALMHGRHGRPGRRPGRRLLDSCSLLCLLLGALLRGRRGDDMRPIWGRRPGLWRRFTGDPPDIRQACIERFPVFAAYSLSLRKHVFSNESVPRDTTILSCRLWSFPRQPTEKSDGAKGTDTGTDKESWAFPLKPDGLRITSLQRESQRTACWPVSVRLTSLIVEIPPSAPERGQSPIRDGRPMPRDVGYARLLCFIMWDSLRISAVS